MTKKEILRTIGFALVVCILLVLLCEVFELSDTTYMPTRFKTFYNLNEDTVDAVWLGTSGTDRYWVSSQAYEDYGMTVYPLAVNSMPVWSFPYLIDEIYKHQNPELIIIDMRSLCQEHGVKSTNTRARYILDAMDAFSINKVRLAFRAMRTLDDILEEGYDFDLSFLLSYIKYHSKWEDDDFSISDNISNKACEYNGFFMYQTLSIKSKKTSPTIYRTDYYEDMDPYTEETFYEFLDYIEKKGVNVLFVNTVSHMKKLENGRVNTICRILDERGLNYVNYCETDDQGNYTLIPEMNHKTDFYNRNHVNFYGASKFTAAFSAYLNENYNFTDHRNDPAVAEHWDGVYDKVTATIKEWEDAAAAAAAEAANQ